MRSRSIARKTRGENFFAYNYRQCWKFLKEMKWHVVFAVGIFFLFFIIGLIFPIFFRDQIVQIISGLGSSIEGKGLAYIIWYIFLNNTQASFFAFASGIVVGVFPLGVLILNGYLLGFVGNIVIPQEGIVRFLMVLPHGIFELPAIFFSAAIGLKIGIDMFKKDVGKKLAHNYTEGIRFFIFVVIPLLVIAAIIEGILIISLR